MEKKQSSHISSYTYYTIGWWNLAVYPSKTIIFIIDPWYNPHITFINPHLLDLHQKLSSFLIFIKNHHHSWSSSKIIIIFHHFSHGKSPIIDPWETLQAVVSLYLQCGGAARLRRPPGVDLREALGGAPWTTPACRARGEMGGLSPDKWWDSWDQ